MLFLSYYTRAVPLCQVEHFSKWGGRLIWFVENVLLDMEKQHSMLYIRHHMCRHRTDTSTNPYYFAKPLDFFRNIYYNNVYSCMQSKSDA